MKDVVFYLVVTICFGLCNSLPIAKSDMSNRERYNFFDAELFEVLSQNGNENVVVSPVGVKLLLGMLVEGADGKTAEEILLALRLPVEKALARERFSQWLSSLQVAQPPNVLKMASHVFLSDQFHASQNYTNAMKMHYQTGITPVRMVNTKETCDTINGWASKETSHLIQRLVNENSIHSDTKMILASAVYFKGVWMNPFTGQGRVRCFYGLDNKCHKTFMMAETGFYNFGYIDKLDAQAIQLPYKGGKYSMLILLPSKQHGVYGLSRDLLHVGLFSIISDLKTQEVFIQIPKFEISYEGDLANPLKRLQLWEMFSDNANFSNILMFHTNDMAVNHVFHSAKISVTEEGSEAAAATGAFFVPLMGGPSTSFVANHPFLFFITDAAMNSILFAGKLVMPKLVEQQEVRPSLLPSYHIHSSSPGPTPPPSTMPSSAATVPSSSKPGVVQKSVRPTASDLGTTKNLRQSKVIYPNTVRPDYRPPVNSLLDESVIESSAAHAVSSYDPAVGKPVSGSWRNTSNDSWRYHVLFFN